MCHGSLKVKTLTLKVGDPRFKSRLWRILVFSIFPENSLDFLADLIFLPQASFMKMQHQQAPFVQIYHG